jgi:hypothetical protein
VKPFIALALVSASLISMPAFAAPYGRGGDRDGGPDPGAPSAYAGASKEGFYNVEERMDRVEQRIHAMGRGGMRAMAAMRQVRAFAAQQKARHGGELRDWDREAINLRLDQLVGRYRVA